MIKLLKYIILSLFIFLSVNIYGNINKNYDAVSKPDATRVSTSVIEPQENLLEEFKPNYSFLNFIKRTAEDLDIKSDDLIKLITIESNWNSNAISSAGAVGLMQLKKAAAKDVLGYYPTTKELQNPYFNVYVGARYFKQMITYANGDVDLALLCYYAGYGRALNYIRNNPHYNPKDFWYNKRFSGVKNIAHIKKKIDKNYFLA